MANVEAVKLKKGDYILYNNNVNKVVRTEFYNPGKGSALMKVRIQDVLSGKSVDYTYKSVEMVETVEVNGSTMQYLYKDADNFYFMDNKSFEQYEMPIDLLGDAGRFLKESEEYHVYLYDGRPIDLNFGGSITLKIIKAEDVVAGNTSTNITKPATVETGAEVRVPPFIKIGDMVSINPDTGEYRGRVNS
jgi:elongation factor P